MTHRRFQRRPAGVARRGIGERRGRQFAEGGEISRALLQHLSQTAEVFGGGIVVAAVGGLLQGIVAFGRTDFAPAKALHGQPRSAAQRQKKSRLTRQQGGRILLAQTRQGIARERLRERTRARGAIRRDRLLHAPLRAGLLPDQEIAQGWPSDFRTFVDDFTATAPLDPVLPRPQRPGGIRPLAGAAQQVHRPLVLFLTGRDPGQEQ